MAERWAAKPKGFATVKRGGWWVRPQSTAPLSGPSGGTTTSTPRNKLVPREWTGSPGVIGSWKAEPRLNPDQYEWQLNPENNRWFARPVTDATGFNATGRRDLAQFDRGTEAQQARIGETYSTYAQQAAADRDAGAAAFGTLAKLSSAGFGDATGVGLSRAEQALPGVLAQGSREGIAADAGQSLFRMAQLPTLARDAGASALSQYAATRQGQRTELISAARQTQAEAEAARREAAAEIRAQNLRLLGQRIGADTQIGTATIRARTAEGDRAAKLEMEAARLATQAQIARERNLTSRANTLDTLAAKKRAEAKKEKAKQRKPPSMSDLRQLTQRARDMWDGIPAGKDAEGNPQYTQYSASEILNELISSGLTRARAKRMVTQITGERFLGIEPGDRPIGSVLGW